MKQDDRSARREAPTDHGESMPSRGERSPTDAILGLLDAPGELVPEDATARDRARAIVKRGLIGLDAEPMRIGRFVVLRQLGAGGMGVVYAAYDEELDRKIALKVIRNGDSSPSDRMRREAQVMAKLSHPNVVHVYDVGTHDGELFIAMEYVRGTTLGRWCTERARDVAEIVAVFRQAGEGLAAAHAVGLIHRDFKPENVLVGEDGRVRVVDFGLARRTDLTRASTTAPHDGDAPSPTADPTTSDRPIADDRLTRTGALLGTPAYMAPEQFLGATIDTRTDQFAFCIALWEALYGERPFVETGLESLAFAVTQGRPRPAPAGARVPRYLHDALLVGLQTDPTHRHASMTALLTALGDDPRRKRTIVAAIGMLGAAGLLAFGAKWWADYDRDRQIERVAQACADAGASITETWNDRTRQGLHDALSGTGVAYAPLTAERVTTWLDAYAHDWQSARTDACMDADVYGTLDPAALDRQRWCLDERRTDLSALVTELSRGDARAVQKAVAAAASLTRVASCRDADVLARAPTPPSDRRPEVAAIHAELSRAAALRATGAFDEGLAVARAALHRAEAVSWPPAAARARVRTGLLLESMGEFAEAESQFEAAYFEAADAGATEIAIEAGNQLVFTVGLRLVRHPEALRWSRLTALLLSPATDPTGMKTADHLDKTALVHASRGAHAEAIAMLEQAIQLQERALGPEHPDLVAKLSNLASVAMEIGKAEQARPHYERALHIAERALGPEHPTIGTLLHNLGNVRFALGDLEGARSHYERGLEIRERALDPNHPDIGGSLNNLGQLLATLNEYEPARAYLLRAIAIAERTFGPDHPEVAGSLGNLGSVHQATGAFEDAVAANERALSILETALGPEHPRVAMIANNLGNAFASLGDYERAQPLLERALTIREAVLGREHPEVAQSLHNLAALHRGRGESDRAREYEEREHAIASASRRAEAPAGL